MTDPREALATVASFIEADRDYQHDERPDLSAALDVLGALVDADPHGDPDDGPFCWCGHDASRHSQPGDAVRPFCNGCAFDAQEDDEADPRHEFEDAALIDERLRVQHQTTQNFVVAMRQVEGSADPEDDDEDRNPLDDGLAYVQAHGDWHGSTVDLALHQVADLREVIERMGPQLAGVNAYADGPRRDLDSAQEVLMREVNRLAAYWAEPLLEAIEDQDGGEAR